MEDGALLLLPLLFCAAAAALTRVAKSIEAATPRATRLANSCFFVFLLLLESSKEKEKKSEHVGRRRKNEKKKKRKKETRRRRTERKKTEEREKFSPSHIHPHQHQGISNAPILALSRRPETKKSETDNDTDMIGDLRIQGASAISSRARAKQKKEHLTSYRIASAQKG